MPIEIQIKYDCFLGYFIILFAVHVILLYIFTKLIYYAYQASNYQKMIKISNVM